MSSATAPQASLSPVPPAPSPLDPREAALLSAFERWNRATNAADKQELERLYAPNLSLYGRIVGRSDAIKRKVEYVAQHPGFEQRVADAVWESRGPDRSVRFRKTSSVQGKPPSIVDAYLLWREVDGSFRIIDEGDVQSARKLEAKLEAQREHWTPKTYDCPSCSDPNWEDEPPEARAPLGPDLVKASGAVPPGAPELVGYGRATFERFASAVDVPLFLKATHLSGNADGRWFYYDALDAPANAAPNPKPEQLLYCAIGGSLSQEPPPASAKPDPGHVGEPKVVFTTRFERRGSELYYERHLYSADGVENYVYCTFAPAYEAYFYAIVQRMGRSMRAIGGGQTERASRPSQPYVPFDP